MPDKADVAMDGEIPLPKVAGSNYVRRSIEAQRLEAPPAGRQRWLPLRAPFRWQRRSNARARTVAEQMPVSRKRLFAQRQRSRVGSKRGRRRSWRAIGSTQTRADDCECAVRDLAITRDAGPLILDALQCGGQRLVRRIAERTRPHAVRIGANCGAISGGTIAGDSRLRADCGR